LGLPDDDVRNFALVTAIHTDLGNTSIFPPLISGGCVHVIGYEESVDGSLWARYLTKNQIDVLKITPSNLDALMTSAAGGNVLPRRFLILGGESLSWQMIQRIREAGACTVINHYGPTETTIGCLSYVVTETDSDTHFAATVPLGRPLANSHVHILDRYR